jgi:hypothetical protein
LIFPLWFTFLGGSFVFLDVGPSILFFVLPLFWGALIYLWLGGLYQLFFLLIKEICMELGD